MNELHEILVAIDRVAGAKPKNRLTGFASVWQRKLTGLPHGWPVVEKELGDVILSDINAPIMLIDVKHNLTRLREVASSLGECQMGSPDPSFILFINSQGLVNDLDQRQGVYEQFPLPERVEFISDQQDVADRIKDLIAKIQALKHRGSPPRPSPLDSIQAVIEATADLREGGGNLSAQKIADVFDIKMAELARLLGRSPQTLSKTPDADSLQNDLSYFERIARLRLRLRNDESFRKWLRMKSDRLGGTSPMDIIQQKHWQELADYVDDLLTGAPA